jgi:hypothetical protein
MKYSSEALLLLRFHYAARTRLRQPRVEPRAGALRAGSSRQSGIQNI